MRGKVTFNPAFFKSVFAVVFFNSVYLTLSARLMIRECSPLPMMLWLFIHLLRFKFEWKMPVFQK